VVADGLTLIGVPEPTDVPPQLPVNQSTVWPAATVAEREDEAPEQMLEGVADGLVGVLGRGLTVTITWAQVVLMQPVVVLRARA